MIDWLVILGGGMNVYQYRLHPWLREEKQFIERAIAAKKTVLGICLGAQLIADVLGAKVYQNAEIELGWLPVKFHSANARDLFADFPSEMSPLHWHGDTFDLPNGAVHVAESTQCINQAFVVGENIVGLQFHIEVGAVEVRDYSEGEPEWPRGKFVQTREEVIAGSARVAPIHAALHSLLRRLEAKTKSA
jgi:GMP synthase (glutamine-hydrolysing)